MNDYDVQMAEAESSDSRAGDVSRRYRDRQILLRQYPGPDAKRFFSWTRGPLAQHLANKDAPADMPNVVMDLSYALDPACVEEASPRTRRWQSAPSRARTCDLEVNSLTL